MVLDMPAADSFLEIDRVARDPLGPDVAVIAFGAVGAGASPEGTAVPLSVSGATGAGTSGSAWPHFPRSQENESS